MADDNIWRRASGSTDRVHPIEVAQTIDGAVSLRLGEHHPGMTVPEAEWFTFLAAAKAGEFDDVVPT